MTYKINKTDGSLLAEVIDSTIDQTATDITLIGKNTSNFGEFLNENFVHILENFASTSSPNRPITGQLWFDTNELRLKVYNGQQWKQGSGPIVSGTAPLTSSLTQGDFWIDSAENQLYFYDGEEGLKLAGPIYKQSQGVSGFEVKTIRDADNIERVILVLWLGGTVLGIFSKNTVNFEIPNGIFSTGVVNNPIKPGFNVCNVPTTGTNVLKFNVTASNADTINVATGMAVGGSSFLRNDIDNSAVGPIRIASETPLYLGLAGQVKINVTNAGLIIADNGAVNKRVGIFNNAPQYSLDVTGTFRASSKIKLPVYTTVERDARTDQENGEIIYNSTSNKVEAYANGSWVPLH
jgi:hypothetical protein